MPFPISTVLLVLSVALIGTPHLSEQIVGFVLGSLAILNEVVRAIVLRSSEPASEYQIPAQPRNRQVRNPLVPADDAS